MRWFFSNRGQSPKQSSRHLKVQKSNSDKWLWLHVASLGEYNTILPLLKKMRQQTHDKILLTYFNQDIHHHFSQEEKNKKIKNRWIDEFFFLPFENILAYESILSNRKITSYWAIEGEFWPLLFLTLTRYEVKMFLFNAPFFEKEWGWYRRLKVIYRPMIDCFSKIYTTHSTFYERFLAMGIDEKKLKKIYNLKYYGSSLRSSLRKTLDRFHSVDLPNVHSHPFQKTSPSHRSFTILMSSIHCEEIKSILKPLVDLVKGDERKTRKGGERREEVEKRSEEKKRHYRLIIAPRYTSRNCVFSNVF